MKAEGLHFHYTLNILITQKKFIKRKERGGENNNLRNDLPLILGSLIITFI